MNDRLPFQELLADLQSTLRRAAVLAAVALLIGVFIPGVIQYQRGTFFRDDIITKLASIPDGVQQKIKDFDDTTKALKQALTQVDKRIANEASTLDAKSLLELAEARNNMSAQIKQRQSDLHVAPVYLDPLTIVWMVFYVSFFWLIFMFAPRLDKQLRPADLIINFVGVWILSRWPTWLRNTTFFRYQERKVYAGTNWDVDRVSFFLQEFQAAIVCLLIVVLFTKWCKYFSLWRVELDGCIALQSDGFRSEIAVALTRQFVHWQICSLLLGAAFLPYTYFFWNYVSILHDSRYVFHAVIVHSIWGVLWLTISTPIFLTWYRLRMLNWAAKPDTDSDEDAVSHAELESSDIDTPIGSLNFVGSIITAVATFFAPIIKGILFA